MTFEEFKKKILDVVRKSGETPRISFSIDEETGVYHAICSNGVRFSGNNNSLKLIVRWGSGHQAITP